MKNHQKMNMFDLIFAFAGPMVIGKCLVVYFGSKYSSYPGEGYGIGLVLSISFTLSMMGRFVWKYRHIGEPERKE